MAKGEIKRNSKDSVFCDLVREPEYQLLLYLTLHPEDTDVTVEDIRICRNEDVLAEYLSRKETEVMNMVDVLRDVDWNLKILNKQAVDNARTEGKLEQKAENDKKHDDETLARIMGVMESFDAHGFAKEICRLRGANPAQQTTKGKDFWRLL